MSDSIRAVDRALDVLLCFTRQRPQLSMTQIAELVGMHKSTVHRLLLTLEKKQFVQRDPISGVYQPGIRFLQLASLSLENNSLRQIAAPYMRRLQEQHLETVDLGILDGEDIVFLDVLESPQRIRLAAAVGQRLPAFCTASGKAILALLPEENVRQILQGSMKSYTPNTPLSVEAILGGLRQARQLGFAISVEEFEDGINAVSAPIVNSEGVPVASIAIAGPSYRLTVEQMEAIGPSIAAATSEISREIVRGRASP